MPVNDDWRHVISAQTSNNSDPEQSFAAKSALRTKWRSENPPEEIHQVLADIKPAPAIHPMPMIVNASGVSEKIKKPHIIEKIR